MFKNNQVEALMNATLINLKNLSDVDTVIGKPITLPDNSILIPVSKVSMGFLVGGGEYNDKGNKNSQSFPLTGGSGAGLSVNPIGFLHASVCESEFIKIDESSDKLSDFISATINSIKNKAAKWVKYYEKLCFI